MQENVLVARGTQNEHYTDPALGSWKSDQEKTCTEHVYEQPPYKAEWEKQRHKEVRGITSNKEQFLLEMLSGVQDIWSKPSWMTAASEDAATWRQRGRGEVVKCTEGEATRCIWKAGGKMVVVGVNVDRLGNVSEFQTKQVL